MSLFKKNAKNTNESDMDTEQKADELTPEQVAAKIAEEAVKRVSFACGVEEVFLLEETDDRVVVGKVEGTVRLGDRVMVTNFGVESEPFSTTVLAIELGPEKPVTQATDCMAAMRLEDLKGHEIRVGTVVHTRNLAEREIYKRYYSALGDVYVAKRQMALSEVEYDKLSYAELAECWNLYVWFTNNVMKPSNEHEQGLIKDRMDKVAKVIVKKILLADSVYCVFSEHTGEPFLYSKTVKKDNSFMCSPVGIVLFPKQYESIIVQRMGDEEISVRKIANGKDKQGICNFLGQTFYANGVDEVLPVFKNVAISNRMLVDPPDFSKMPSISVPIMNPNLEKWLLLIGQLGQPTNEEQNVLFQVYYHFAALEFPTAQFIVPMKGIRPEDMEKPDAQGRAVIKKDTKFSIATLKGKNERPAVAMYTDWRRLRMRYPEEWNGMIMKMENLIGQYDCVVNVTKYVRASSYITQEMFAQMLKELQKAKQTEQE